MPAAKQVVKSHRYLNLCTKKHDPHYIFIVTVFEYMFIPQLQETVARQDLRIQMLEKQVRRFSQKSPVRLILIRVHE